MITLTAILATMILAVQVLILRKLSKANQVERAMSQQTDALIAVVQAQETVEDSTIALLQGLSTQLAAANTANGQAPNPAVTSVIAMIQADTAKMAAAVATYTPAPSPAPVPDPAPVDPNAPVAGQ